MTRYSVFESSRRRCSRIALYSQLVLAAVLLVVFLSLLRRPLESAGDQSWGRTDFAALPEVQLLQRYLEIDTSFPDGDERDGARFLREVLEAEGIEIHAEPVGDTRVNLWAALEGKRPEALVLHHHIDVEPVPDPAQWEHDPFGGEIDGPWIYGRGAFDMKSVGIAQLLAFLDLHRRQVPLERSVILLATSSEETGSDLGMRWILQQHPELVDRFWAVLTEGGAVEVRQAGKVKFWGTEFAQKRYVDYVLCTYNRPLLEDVRRDLAAQSRPLTGLRLVPEVEYFLEHYAPSRDDPDLQDLLADPQRLTWDVPAFLEAPLPIQSMLRDELHVFPIEAMSGGGWRMTVKIHLLPGSDLEEVTERLMPPWILHGVTGRVAADEPAASSSPLDHPVYGEIEALLGERHGADRVGPLFLTWAATDARHLRAHGVPAYGFSPFAVPTPEVLSLIGLASPEEKIALPGYVEGVDLYRRVVERLATWAGSG